MQAAVSSDGNSVFVGETEVEVSVLTHSTQE